MFTAEVLNQSLDGLGLKPDSALFEALHAAYGEEHRHYHTSRHISNCLENLQCASDLAERLHEVELAVWFHDAVYDTHRNDNEEKSAAWAVDYLSRHGASRDVTRRIARMILATRAHSGAVGDTGLLLDVDLAILGAAPTEFEAYDAAIRREYAWVPIAEYNRARIRVLNQFLDAPQIYGTDYFRRRLEENARRNLRQKIALLK